MARNETESPARRAGHYRHVGVILGAEHRLIFKKKDRSRVHPFGNPYKSLFHAFLNKRLFQLRLWLGRHGVASCAPLGVVLLTMIIIANVVK